MKMVKVIATSAGYYQKLRTQGEEFLVDEKLLSGKKPKWFALVGEAVIEADKPEADEPDTLSEVNKANAKKEKAAAAKKEGSAV